MSHASHVTFNWDARVESTPGTPPHLRPGMWLFLTAGRCFRHEALGRADAGQNVHHQHFAQVPLVVYCLLRGESVFWVFFLGCSLPCVAGFHWCATLSGYLQTLLLGYTSVYLGRVVLQCVPTR